MNKHAQGQHDRDAESSQWLRQDSPLRRPWLVAALTACAALPFILLASGLDVLYVVLAAALGIVFCVSLIGYRVSRGVMQLKDEDLLYGLYPNLGVLVHPSSAPGGLLSNGVLFAVLLFAPAVMLGLGPLGLLGRPGHSLDDLISVTGAAFTLQIAVAYLPFTLLGALVIRRWGSTPPTRVLTVYLLLSAVLGALGGHLVTSTVLAPFIERYVDPMWSAGAALLHFAPYFIVLSLGSSLKSRELAVRAWSATLELERQRSLAAERERAATQAQLAMLQAQIEPHFLYNTLASVQYLVSRDAPAAEHLLSQLNRYLRHAMPRLRAPDSTLGQEFELADAYLQIAQVRMGPRLSVHVELEEALHEHPFPPLLLQTLVENALKHGVEPKVGPVRVELSAQRQDGWLNITVADDGVGLSRQRSPTAGTGQGLANIRARLLALYGERAQLIVEQPPEGGVRATIRVQDAATQAAAQGNHGPTVAAHEALATATPQQW